ncbi:uncharacterized protein LOC133188752, partial [Saccostrea echinata]|uniref:uncharacterized protein LOC133188752 n=1 Tax=Saccostrea echinata TaxID=191078 RepID=UPI002A81142A
RKQITEIGEKQRPHLLGLCVGGHFIIHLSVSNLSPWNIVKDLKNLFPNKTIIRQEHEYETLRIIVSVMNPYGKTKSWFCRTDRCDSTSVGGRTVPSLLRLDSTGNTLNKRENHTAVNNSMASCFAKTVGGIIQKNNLLSKDNFVGNMSDFPILQNSCDCACDKKMAAKNSDSINMPVTSCFGSFQGLAGCLGLNACSSISQHPTLHHGHFQLPYLQFHPAVVSAFPRQTESAKKQFVKCQSQRTGKKSNRYFRYGWKAPPRKSSPEGEKAGAETTKSEDASVRKKQKCDKSERTRQDVEKNSEKKKEEKANYSNSGDCLSSHMCNLSLGESVAIENALNDCTALKFVCTDLDKSKPDWFSIGRQESEIKLSPSNTVTVLDNWDDEIYEETQSENTKLQEEISALLATDDVKIGSKPSANNTQNIGDEPVQSMDMECENTSTTIVKSNCNDSQKIVTDVDGVDTHQCQNNEPHAVLFQRSMHKKCRPSNKKRSRRKSSKHPKSFRCDQGQKRKLEDGNASNCGASAIAFIMGNCDPHSILDSDSEFSFDSDEDSCESMEDDIDFQFADPLSFCEKAIFPTKSSPGQEVSQAVSAANRAWHIGSQESSPKDAQLENKKVHFARAENLTVTHEADEWNRKGHWEEYARDRERFKRRIEELQRVLDPVLKQKHREHVYKKLHTA